MGSQPPSDEELTEAVRLYGAHGTKQAAANAGGLAVSTFKDRLRRAAAAGMMLNHAPAMPGFEITKVTTAPNGGQTITQAQEGEQRATFELPKTHFIGKMTVQRDAEGRVVQDWIRAMPDDAAREAAFRAVVAGLKEELPHVRPTTGPAFLNDQLANQFTVTDHHLNMMAWAEETGSADWDLKLGEKVLINWFSAAIAMSPNAKLAVLAQLGDFLHHDAHESVTPAHRNVLDADSRLQKVIRVSIRVIRQIISMLLQKHERVHVVMASGNHDPASSAWLRELLASMYENEPRITVDNSPDIYYVYPHGRTGLFYHHGHKRNIDKVGETFAGKFREVYGNSLQCYGHVGHLHSDAVVEGSLMKVERHRTLAPADSYSANGGWLSGRDAKVITYHKEFGEVGRSIISPRMLAANDNQPLAVAA